MIPDKPSKPGWPEILQVTNDSVNIHWKAPEDDGGRTITNYIVEYRSVALLFGNGLGGQKTLMGTTYYILYSSLALVHTDPKF